MERSCNVGQSGAAIQQRFGAETSERNAALSVTTQLDIQDLQWSSRHEPKDEELRVFAKVPRMGVPSLPAQENIAPAPTNICSGSSPQPDYQEKNLDAADAAKPEPSQCDEALSPCGKLTNAAEADRDEKESPQSSNSEIEVLVSVDGSEAGSCSEDKRKYDDDSREEDGSGAGGRRSKRSVQPAQKLRDANFLTNHSKLYVGKAASGGSVQESPQPLGRLGSSESKVRKLAKSILDLADKFPWQAVEDDRREVWEAFHNRLRAETEVKKVMEELLWMTGQVDDCVLQEDWEEKSADWKARCERCEHVGDAVELFKEYSAKAVDWNATTKLFQLEKEEERRRLGRKTGGKKKGRRIQQPRRLSAAGVNGHQKAEDDASTVGAGDEAIEVEVAEQESQGGEEESDEEAEEAGVDADESDGISSHSSPEALKAWKATKFVAASEGPCETEGHDGETLKSASEMLKSASVPSSGTSDGVREGTGAAPSSSDAGKPKEEERRGGKDEGCEKAVAVSEDAASAVWSVDRKEAKQVVVAAEGKDRKEVAVERKEGKKAARESKTGQAAVEDVAAPSARVKEPRTGSGGGEAAEKAEKEVGKAEKEVGKAEQEVGKAEKEVGKAEEAKGEERVGSEAGREKGAEAAVKGVTAGKGARGEKEAGGRGAEEKRGARGLPKGLKQGRELLNKLVKKIHYHAFSVEAAAFKDFHRDVGRCTDFEQLQQQLAWVVGQLLGTVLQKGWSKEDTKNWEFGYRASATVKEFEQSLQTIRSKCIDWAKVHDPGLRGVSPPDSPSSAPAAGSKRPFQGGAANGESIAKKGKLALKAAMFRAGEEEELSVESKLVGSAAGGRGGGAAGKGKGREKGESAGSSNDPLGWVEAVDALDGPAEEVPAAGAGKGAGARGLTAKGFARARASEQGNGVGQLSVADKLSAVDKALAQARERLEKKEAREREERAAQEAQRTVGARAETVKEASNSKALTAGAEEKEATGATEVKVKAEGSAAEAQEKREGVGAGEKGVGVAGSARAGGAGPVVQRKTANLAMARKSLNKFVRAIPYTAFEETDKGLFVEFHKGVDASRAPSDFRERMEWVAKKLLPEVLQPGWESRRAGWEKELKASESVAGVYNLVMEFKTRAYDRKAAESVVRRARTREVRELAEEKEREAEELELAGRTGGAGKRKRGGAVEVKSEAEELRERIGSEVLGGRVELPEWGTTSGGFLETWKTWSSAVRETANEVGVHPLEVQYVWKHGRMPRLKAGGDPTALVQRSQNDKTKFKLVQRNLYRTARPREVRKEDEQVCECAQEGGAGRAGGASCDSDKCVNRAVFVECSPGRCGAVCRNQRLQRREYPKAKVFFTGDRGYGLRVEERVRRGNLVQEYMGEVIERGEWKRRLAEYTAETQVYMFTLEKDLFIDASAYGSLARFINHSCAPNCFTQKWQVGNEQRVGIFAARDIEAGEELTYNYIFESFGEERHECFCGAPTCTGYMGERPRGAAGGGDSPVGDGGEGGGGGGRRKRAIRATAAAPHEVEGKVVGRTRSVDGEKRTVVATVVDEEEGGEEGVGETGAEEEGRVEGQAAGRRVEGEGGALKRSRSSSRRGLEEEEEEEEAMGWEAGDGGSGGACTTVCWECKRGEFRERHYTRAVCRDKLGHDGVDWRLDPREVARRRRGASA